MLIKFREKGGDRRSEFAGNCREFKEGFSSNF